MLNNVQKLRAVLLYITASLICLSALLLVLSGFINPARGRGWQAIGFAALYVPLSVFFFVRARRLQVHTHRVMNGLCLRCGYDTRATPERCPECGTSR
jgi:hypothetical protein